MTSAASAGRKIARSHSFERVARGDLAALHAGHEPAHALLGAAVRKAFRNDLALRTPLDVVVTDRGRGAHRFFDVAGFEQLAIVGVVRPDASEAIGLQLEPHR